jgi:hypothetical protein
MRGYRQPAGHVKYGAPEGMHDDTVMALAFAWYGAKRRAAGIDGRYAVRSGDAHDADDARGNMLNSIFQKDTRGNRTPNPADMSYLRMLAEDDEAQQAHYQALRDYYDGFHEVPLTTRQKEYLARDSEFEFALNYLPLPVSTS